MNKPDYLTADSEKLSNKEKWSAISPDKSLEFWIEGYPAHGYICYAYDLHRQGPKDLWEASTLDVAKQGAKGTAEHAGRLAPDQALSWQEDIEFFTDEHWDRTLKERGFPILVPTWESDPLKKKGFQSRD